MKQDPLFRELPDSFDPPVQTAAPKPNRCRTFAGWLAIGTGMWLFGTLVTLWQIVPKFAESYAQVKLPLPEWTEGVLAVYRAVVEWPVSCFLFAVVAAVSAGFLSGSAKKAATVLLPIIIVLTIGWLAGGLFVPFIGTLEGIGQGRR